MRSLTFDTSTIISLVTNNLLWVLKPLKEKFKGNFYITNAVKEELIDRPIKTKKFKFEAITIMQSIKENNLILFEEGISSKVDELLFLANHIFNAKNEWLNIVHKAEVEALALASYLKSEAFVTDERTIRLLVENPRRLNKLLQNKLHTRVTMDIKNLMAFQHEIGRVNIIRSSDLMVIAFESGLLNKFIFENGSKKNLLDGVLWGIKLRGCSVSEREINEIMKIEGF